MLNGGLSVGALANNRGELTNRSPTGRLPKLGEYRQVLYNEVPDLVSEPATEEEEERAWLTYGDEASGGGVLNLSRDGFTEGNVMSQQVPLHCHTLRLSLPQCI
ncbi:hypothetical protein ABZP36_022813 [Zizania latifolia]